MRAQVRIMLGIAVWSLAAVAGGEETTPRVLPLWVDAGQAGSTWIETSFPSPEKVAPTITAATRFLVVSVTASDFDDWGQTAYALKQVVVETRARSPRLEVGLQAPAATAQQLLVHGLAPYLDAYVYCQEPFVPTNDGTAGHWWRTAADEQNLLDTLLAARRRGSELVLLDNITVAPAQRQLLEAIQVYAAAELVPQPVVTGIDQDRVHFFLAADGGSYYLAVQAPTGEARPIAFTLGHLVRAHQLFPMAADCQLESSGSQSELTLSGEHRFALFELRHRQQPHRGRCYRRSLPLPVGGNPPQKSIGIVVGSLVALSITEA